MLHTQITNITAQISAFNLLVADKQDELDAAQETYDVKNEESKVSIRVMEEDGSLSYWEVLFKATSFSNLLYRLNMVEEIAQSDARRLQELSDAANAVETFRQELVSEKAELDEAKEELDATQIEPDAKREEEDALIQALLDRTGELAAYQLQMEDRADTLLDEIAEMEVAYNEAKQQEWLAYIATATTASTAAATDAAKSNGIDFSGCSTASTDNTTSTEDTSSGNSNSAAVVGSGWIIPVNYTLFSSPFGIRTDPITGELRNHRAVDLAAPAGTTIVASRGGTVTAATYDSDWGYYVMINHGDGYSSLYAHMSSYAVSAGQTVSQGQTIGYVSRTGKATGNHLHFGILYNGAYVNPASYVSFY